MSERLRVPERLKGPWEHALILTYGLDLPFFERSLWAQLDPRCRNRIILADGRRYVEACARYAESAVRRPPGEIRHLNRAYVAEGVFAPHAAHAKVILLASPTQGRLLVGSGNLGWLGYASGGEQFTEYNYRQDDPTHLPAFLAVREFLELLCARGYVSETAQERVVLLLEGAPWLFGGVATAVTPPPVAHTLTTSMLAHLQQVVGDEAVEELWVHAPFYDPDAAALRALLRAVRPARAYILVQPGHTSVDPTALQQAIADASETESFIRPFRTRRRRAPRRACEVLSPQACQSRRLPAGLAQRLASGAPPGRPPRQRRGGERAHGPAGRVRRTAGAARLVAAGADR